MSKYVHSKDEFPSLDIKVKGSVVPGNVTNINIGVNEIKSEENVRDLILNSRKCRFRDEPEKGSFYEVRTIHFCSLNVSIESSFWWRYTHGIFVLLIAEFGLPLNTVNVFLSSMREVVIFELNHFKYYKSALFEIDPICNASGMFCLYKNSNWTSPPCECLDTCSSITYREHAVAGGQMVSLLFSFSF